MKNYFKNKATYGILLALPFIFIFSWVVAFASLWASGGSWFIPTIDANNPEFIADQKISEAQNALTVNFIVLSSISLLGTALAKKNKDWFKD